MIKIRDNERKSSKGPQILFDLPRYSRYLDSSYREFFCRIWCVMIRWPKNFVRAIKKFKKSSIRVFDSLLQIFLTKLLRKLWRLKLRGHERIFHEIATKFPNCCNFTEKSEVSPGTIFFVAQHFIAKKCFSNKIKISNRFEFLFLLLQHFLREKSNLEKNV